MDPLSAGAKSASGPDTVPDGLAEATPAPTSAPTPPFIARDSEFEVSGPVEFAAVDSGAGVGVGVGAGPGFANAADDTLNNVADIDTGFDETESLASFVEPLHSAKANTEALSPPPPAMAALVDLLDRDGQVRQSIAIPSWPIRVGRGLDNDVVLSDPHVAASHVSIARTTQSIELDVGATRNGVLLGNKRLRGGEAREIAVGDEPIELTLGRTRLRLRLPEQPLHAEVPLASATPLWQRLRPIVIAAIVLVLGLVFTTYLDTDPDGFGRAVGNMLLVSVVGAAIWCGAWALLSKTFTRQGHFGWHLRVFLFASIAMLVVGALPALLAFAFSWSWITDFAFVGVYVVAAAALYFHLLAVEPARHRLLRWVAVVGAVTGVGLTLWFNLQRSDQFGEELYMNHLFPPALRLARPVPADRFVNSLGSLKATLDKKAKDTSLPDEASGRSEDEE